MPIYSKQSLQLLADLVNAANPTLPVALTPTNVKWGTPTTVTPSGGNIQDTQIKVTALASGQYIGNQTLTYRRINFGNLFRALPIRIDKYSSANLGTSPYKISDLLGAINAKYGLSLTSADIVDGNLPAGTTNAQPAIGLAAGTRNSSITVNAATGSYAFEGSFTLYWVQAPQDISTMVTTTSLESARVYPGNKNTVDASLYVVDLDTYQYDFTDSFNNAATSEGISLATFISRATNTTIGNTSDGLNQSRVDMVNAIATLSGKSYVATSPASANLSLYGIKATHYTLPDAVNVPEANSKYYNNCLVIDILPANSWGTGRLILHYNV
jgi:hypothetical protein